MKVHSAIVQNTGESNSVDGCVYFRIEKWWGGAAMVTDGIAFAATDVLHVPGPVSILWKVRAALFFCFAALFRPLGSP